MSEIRKFDTTVSRRIGDFLLEGGPTAFVQVEYGIILSDDLNGVDERKVLSTAIVGPSHMFILRGRQDAISLRDALDKAIKMMED